MKIIKNVSIIGLCLCSGFLLGYNMKDDQQDQTPQERQILVDDNMVKIEYIPNEQKELFDLLVTPKQGYNVGTENTMIDTINYKDAYITGWSINKAGDFFSKNPNYKNIPFTWNQ